MKDKEDIKEYLKGIKNLTQKRKSKIKQISNKLCVLFGI